MKKQLNPLVKKVSKHTEKGGRTKIYGRGASITGGSDGHGGTQEGKRFMGKNARDSVTSNQHEGTKSQKTTKEPRNRIYQGGTAEKNWG